mmetsp:Transcript_57308/g.161872  ORF Transcript_57308/g.161872 Transcript_57308/m.161872 type:complete len:560 (+) Transcript_57308:39-1718(+)
MLGWLNSNSHTVADVKTFYNVTDGLQQLYQDKLLPFEKASRFHEFYSPELADADFASKPMVLLIGQYSTGKSTFIRHLLGRDYPGLRIGPEPTTEKFVAVVHGDNDQVIPGNAIVADTSMPFTKLNLFGNAFLSRFECAKVNTPVLEGITLIDTPGVLAGEKQRIKRGYEFDSVVKWFVDRVDMILLLFDVSKLDISDEFRRVIQALRGHDHKIHIILNKADRVTTPQLMRVYGALMWSLGKVIDSPEVARVYIGSFWDEPLTNDSQRKLFESEENDLFTNLAGLPHSAAVRKLNDLIKRARLARVHAFILDYLKRKMPSMWGKGREQKRLLANLPQVFQDIAKERNLPLGDFPDPQQVREILSGIDFATLPKLDRKKLEVLDSMLEKDVPKLLTLVPDEMMRVSNTDMGMGSAEPSPFSGMKVGGGNETTIYQQQWLTAPDPELIRQEFMAMGPGKNGTLSGQKAKDKMVESRLPSNVLHKIWNLADIDKDGLLNMYEYALAMHLIKMRLEGQDLPASLPPSMMPHMAAGMQDDDFGSPAKSPTNSAMRQGITVPVLL